MICDQFLRQFRVLAWKNGILKIRAWGTLLLELLIPIIIIILLGVVKMAIPTKTVPQSFPSDYSSSSTLDTLYTFNAPTCRDQNLVYSCLQKKGCVSDLNGAFLKKCQQRRIAVAPGAASNVAAVSAATAFLDYAQNASAIGRSRSTFTYFESETAFLNYMGSPAYSVDPNVPIYSSAIIFNNGYPDWDYSVRLNMTFSVFGRSVRSPDTSLPDNAIAIKSSSNSPYLEAYLKLGVYTILDTVNSFIATNSLCLKQGYCKPIDKVGIETLGTANFPNVATVTQGFWSAVGFIFALLIIISLLLPLANVIKSLVHEKESKLREGMMMMSLRSDALWMTWIMHFMLLFLPLSIILTFAGKGLFTYSAPTYIFIYFFVFFISATSYSILISNFFSNSRTAAIVGCLVFFMGFFIYIGLQNSNPSRSAILAACLHPAAAFTFGTYSFIEYEDANIGVNSNTWNVSQTFEVTFQDCVNMMFIDAIWMGVLSWYIAKIWPSEFGTHQPFYFLCLPSYWMSCCGINLHKNTSTICLADQDKGLAAHEVAVEPVTDNLERQVQDGTCVNIINLYKVFKTRNGDKVAVDGLNLTMYSGQVTALLGHNGAGKSTAIGMLTGLIPPDGGTAIIDGRDIAHEMPAIRKNLGVCPQHDILFPLLTVEEHLSMFAAFKGTPRALIKDEVEKMIQSVGLTEKRKAYSRTLSGGQKRKLSVAIAFIGGSRIVFLDEPTSGMDPYSRRFTWNVIRQHRQGRVVVLTTHFMDEADLLGDRIAIMGDGKLRCCGSSLFLKRAFGVGYNMTIEKKDVTSFDSAVMTSLVTTAIPTATLHTDVGTELTFQLPLDSSERFQELFDHIDVNEESLGVQSYGMSVTTLEEVFIKVAHGTITHAEADAGREKDAERQVVPVAVIEGNDIESGGKGKPGIITDFSKYDEDAVFTHFWRHLLAMINKRRLYFMRDTRSWIFQYIVPVLFVLVGMLVMRFTAFAIVQPVKALLPTMYSSDAKNYLPTPYSNGAVMCLPAKIFLEDSSGVQCSNVTAGSQRTLMTSLASSGIFNYPATGDVAATSIFTMSQFILSRREDFAASQIGAYSINSLGFSLKNPKSVSSLSYVIHGNYSALHSGPLYASIMADTVLKTIHPAASITVNLFPLPTTYAQRARLSNFNVNLVVIFILLAIPYVPAAFATFIVREREVKAKHQQLVSGVSIPAYWLAAFLWDNFSYQLTVWLIVILVSIFPNTKSLSGLDTIGPTIGLLILFGSAISGFTYLLSFCFSTPSGAQIGIIFIVFFLGLILTIVGLVLRQIPETSGVYLSTIRYIFAVCPPFALGDGLQSLSLLQILSALELPGGQVYSPLDWNITGMNLTFLAWETVVYIVATIAYDYFSEIPLFQRQCLTTPLPITDPALKDEDVLHEEVRVASGAADDCSVVVKDFKKMYPGGKYAVKGMSIAIPTGECFGLLGINGAGKSSALNMLSGEFRPTSGSAHLAGLDLLTDVHKCRRKIGFCPQFDALFELLTAREHLTLYARIKGICEVDVSRVVDSKIAEMGLTEYADRSAGTYSGGNKRKLSVAIAMIGEPSIVFLDEPSTGMDPVARRFMWEIISDIVTKREKCSLILTTHSMEECEALCTRIGIMVGGVLRCLGSSQRLRSKYGHGYQIEIGMVIPLAAAVANKSTELFSALGSDKPFNPNTADGDVMIKKTQLESIFTTLGKSHWVSRICIGGSGAEINTSLSASGYLEIKQLAAWYILEDSFDEICEFLGRSFGGFTLRERQNSRIRVEITAVTIQGERRRLASMFGLIEGSKTQLRIQEYSIAQTSLEQIFNQFAAQQEEEKGPAAGLS